LRHNINIIRQVATQRRNVVKARRHLIIPLAHSQRVRIPTAIELGHEQVGRALTSKLSALAWREARARAHHTRRHLQRWRQWWRRRAGRARRGRVLRVARVGGGHSEGLWHLLLLLLQMKWQWQWRWRHQWQLLLL